MNSTQLDLLRGDGLSKQGNEATERGMMNTNCVKHTKGEIQSPPKYKEFCISQVQKIQMRENAFCLLSKTEGNNEMIASTAKCCEKDETAALHPTRMTVSLKGCISGVAWQHG